MTHEAPRSDCRPTDRKCCSGCGETKPLDQFRRKRRGCDRRETRCRTCHNAYMRWYYRSRKEKALTNFAKQAKWRTDVEYLTALVRAMITRFGGMDEFVRSFIDLYRELASDPACSKEAFAGYRTMIQLLKVIAKEQQAS